MKKPRNRSKQHIPLQQRVTAWSDRWRQEAEASGDRAQRDHLQQRTRSADAALGIIAWLEAREVRRDDQ